MQPKMFTSFKKKNVTPFVYIGNDPKKKKFLDGISHIYTYIPSDLYN